MTQVTTNTVQTIYYTPALRYVKGTPLFTMKTCRKKRNFVQNFFLKKKLKGLVATGWSDETVQLSRRILLEHFSERDAFRGGRKGCNWNQVFLL